ncbi:MAG: hypothetical protein AAFR41_12730 [Pseudomonadota bacterium]
MVANRDVFPADETREIHREIVSLLDVPVIDTLFTEMDKTALKAKRLYHRLGRLAITLIAISAVYTVGDAVGLLAAIGAPEQISIAAVLFAAIGIGLQTYILLSHQKDKWLINRFGVERLRSLKFQAYRLAQAATDHGALKTAVDTFATREVARLKDELTNGMAAIKAFDPSRAIAGTAVPAKAVNPVLAAAALDAFCDLRITYQKRFAQGEIEAMSDRRRIFESSQDFIYAAAAIFAFVALAVKGVEALGVDVSQVLSIPLIDFLAVSLFIAGASKSIMDNASIEDVSKTRYEQYARDVETVSLDATRKTAKLSTIVDRMERTALNELDVFCRAAERISYRL